MDAFKDLIKALPVAQFVFGAIAVCGGMARYLNDYAHGKPFELSLFLASTFVAGFTGWLFATVGQSLNMPQTMVFIMAGTGGFFGEQTMNAIREYVTFRTQTATE